MENHYNLKKRKDLRNRKEMVKVKKIKLIRFDCIDCLVTIEIENHIYQWRFYPCTLEGLIAEMETIIKFLKESSDEYREKKLIAKVKRMKDKMILETNKNLKKIKRMKKKYLTN